MSRRGVVNSVVALAAILVTGGIAIQAVVSDPGSSDRSALVATDIPGRDAVDADSPSAAGSASTLAGATSTNTTVPRRRTATSVPNPVPTPTYPGVTPGQIPPMPPSAITPLAPAATVPPVPPSAVPPPTTTTLPSVKKVSPSSWSLEAEGVTVTASISPAEPRVGDTVTISFTAFGEGDFCCKTVVYVDGAIIDQNDYPEGPCPLPNLTSSSVTVEVTEEGPFSFQVEATRAPQFCEEPHTFATADLVATFRVLPADE